jgi:hypothetical protein
MKSSFGVFIFVQMVGCLAPIGAVCRAARIAGITFTKMPEPSAPKLFTLNFSRKVHYGC